MSSSKAENSVDDVFEADARAIEEMRHHVRAYMMVFGALAILTVVTVGFGYLHFPIGLAVLIALAIATIKGSLVACYFMHLISERKLIYWVLVLAAVFFVAMMFLPLIHFIDPGASHHVP